MNIKVNVSMNIVMDNKFYLYHMNISAFSAFDQFHSKNLL